MSPQDKVERVLKEIHVVFSKSPTYNGHPDKMIIDRKQFLNLLDRLNNGIFDMMEQYEQTRQSRQNAERAFRKKGDEIIEQANSSADDIYAASVIYTADAIGRIRDLMDETNESMNDLFRQFRKDLREQKDLLKSHETELQAQLADLADTKKYLSVIQEMNREREKQNRDLQTEKEAGSQYIRNMIHTPSSSAEIKVNEVYFEKAGKAVPGTKAASPAAAEKPDIKINKDAPYFKWKAQQEEKAKKEEAEDVSAGQDTGKQAAEDPVETELRQFSEQMKGSVAQIAADEAEGTESNAVSEADGREFPNPEFPDEESIRRAVLADELAREADTEAEEQKNRAGRILKNIIFGKE